MKYFRLKRSLAGTAVLLVLISAALTYYITKNYLPNTPVSFQLVLDNNTSYKFVRPLLFFSVPRALGESEYVSLRSSVQKIIDNEPEGDIARYAFYFRDLTTSHWVGINETDQYDPGSLLKVVAAIAAYKQSDTKPGFFNEYLTYTKSLEDMNAQFPFAPPVALYVGQRYTVQSLIKEMLTDSDNAAKDLLLSAIDQPILDSVYTDLQVPKPNDVSSVGYTISARDYSRFFRVLYYGTYNFNWADSNQLLLYLSDSTYTKGLVAGIPAQVPVAHKYGEHVIGSDDVATSIELHDCGIVYHPKTPYFICVMTEGVDEATLAKVISEVSAATYQAVDTHVAQ